VFEHACKLALEGVVSKRYLFAVRQMSSQWRKSQISVSAAFALAMMKPRPPRPPPFTPGGRNMPAESDAQCSSQPPRPRSAWRRPCTRRARFTRASQRGKNAPGRGRSEPEPNPNRVGDAFSSPARIIRRRGAEPDIPLQVASKDRKGAKLGSAPRRDAIAKAMVIECGCVGW
jgi:hypothetical protein